MILHRVGKEFGESPTKTTYYATGIVAALIGAVVFAWPYLPIAARIVAGVIPVIGLLLTLIQHTIPMIRRKKSVPDYSSLCIAQIVFLGLFSTGTVAFPFLLQHMNSTSRMSSATAQLAQATESYVESNNAVLAMLAEAIAAEPTENPAAMLELAKQLRSTERTDTVDKPSETNVDAIVLRVTLYGWFCSIALAWVMLVVHCEMLISSLKNHCVSTGVTISNQGASESNDG